VVKLNGRDLESFDSVRNWLGGLNTKSHWTRVVYLRGLKKFCEWVGKDPDQLIEERKARLRRDILDRTDENRLNAYHQELLRKYSPGTALSCFVSVASFYKYNGVKLKIERFPKVEEWEEKGVKRLHKHEIQKMLSYAENLRDKLIITVGAESGLRSKALCSLTLGCFKDAAYIRDERKYIVSVNKKDTVIPCQIELPKRFYFGRKKEGITFVCEDAIDLLKEFIEQRAGWGEKLTERSPVFPAYRAKLRFESGVEKWAPYLKRYYPKGTVLERVMDSTTRAGKRIVYITEKATIEEVEVRLLSQEGVERVVKKLRRRAGIDHDPENERPANVHSLRKYLRSTLDTCGVSAVLINTIIGHSNGIEDHYSGRRHLDIEEIRHAYESAMHRIALSEKVVVTSIEARLAKEIERREALEKALNQVSTNNIHLKKRIAELQQKLKDLSTMYERVKEERRKQTILDYLYMVHDFEEGEIEEIKRQIADKSADEALRYIKSYIQLEGAERRAYISKTRARKPEYENKLVKEDELIRYLNEGWEIVANVNGKIVVRRPVT